MAAREEVLQELLEAVGATAGLAAGGDWGSDLGLAYARATHELAAAYSALANAPQQPPGPAQQLLDGIRVTAGLAAGGDWGPDLGLAYARATHELAAAYSALANAPQQQPSDAPALR